MEKELYLYNPWWENDYDSLNDLVERECIRDVLAQIPNKQIVFLTGLRRIGKTSLMKLCIKHLLSQNIKPQMCLYVSLDDYRLESFPILDIVEKFRAIHKISNRSKVYLFLDEITFAKNYELQLKNLHDTSNVKIFASSSSASLLNSRKALLTGRSITIEVLPLTFPEYLKFKKISIKKSDGHLVETHFNEFLTSGGIPEYVKTRDIAYIAELIDNIIYKDIAAMHGIRSIAQLKDYFLMLMERSGKTMSVNKISRVLGISPDTSRRFFDLFCDTYIIHPVVRFGKLNEQMVSPRKIYACDTGIRTFYTGERDWGSLFENYVYLRIKHLRPRYITNEGIELDFFTENKWLIECKFNPHPLPEKQQELFDNTKASKRVIVRNEKDIKQLLKLE